jgi:hypothetical protein
MPAVHPVQPLCRAPSGRLHAAALTALVAVVAAGLVPTGAAAQSVVRTLELEQQLLEKQLDEELDAYRQARARADQARTRVGDLSQDLDRAIEGASTGSATDERIAGLERDLDLALERARAAQGEVAGLLDRILERRQRLRLVREEIDRRRGAPASLPDPITGTWRLSLEGGGPERAPARSGLLDLELDGTEIHGTLGLEDGSFGSVRGTFVRGTLALQRVSAGSGLDLILEGDYDPEDGDLEGSWRSAVSGRGEPGGGSWRAVRTEPRESQ